MHFYSNLTGMTAALALVSQSSAFVMDIYDSADCSGTARSVNVWDNTCATWMGGFQSYVPRVYGGPHQKSYFFIPGNCGDLTSSYGVHWVDGGDGNFQVGQCRNFGGNRVMNAVASYSG